MNELEDLLEQIRSISKAAGVAILEIYERDFDVETKDDRSPLTEADRVSHRIITERLAELTPNLPVLSEEAAADEHRFEWPRYWLVDPIDGTKEFIKRNGEFTVNIALVDAHAPVLGVVLAPAIDREYFGGPAVGAAWRADGNGAARPIHVTQPPAQPLRVVGSRSHASAGSLERYLDALGPHELKPMGSSLKICLVAEGEADVYPRFGPTSEWDTAAAHAVLEGAGGCMMDLVGRPLRYNRSEESLLNPHFLAVGDRKRDWLAPMRSNSW